MPRRLTALLAALCLAVAAAPSLAAPAPAPGTVAAVNMQSAEVVVGYLAADGASINPFSCTQCDLVSMNGLVFESLLELDDEMKPKPLLADNWVHEEDGLTWTFNLREGITFHNGAKLTSYDVVASYERHLAAGSENPYYARLATFVSGIEALSETALRVTARYPGYITLYALTFPVAEQSTLYDEIVRGTGPYWLIQYDVDSAVRLEVNPLWWKQQPKVKSILFKRQKDTAGALQALQAGEITMFSSRSSAAALSRKLSDLYSLDYATLTYEMLVPNLRSDKVTSDFNVRQAVMYAIDTATLVSNAYLDMARQGEAPVDSSSWVYESQSAMYYYSPERALKLLLDSGWKDLTGDGMLNKMEDVMLADLTVNIITYNEAGNTVRENAARSIAGYLNAVGIKTNVEVLSRSRVLSRISDREFELALIGVNLSEAPSLVSMFYLDRPLNLNNYSTDAMNAALQATYTAPTESEFKRAMSDLQLLVAQKLPVLGIGFRTGTLLSTSSLAGMSGNRVMEMFRGMEFVSSP